MRWTETASVVQGDVWTTRSVVIGAKSANSLCDTASATTQDTVTARAILIGMPHRPDAGRPLAQRIGHAQVREQVVEVGPGVGPGHRALPRTRTRLLIATG